jgi:microcystin-dependent protein
MPSTFSSNLRLELIGAGEQAGTWNRTTNSNLGDLIEQAISGSTNLDVGPSDITLTALNGVLDQARSAVLTVVGSPGTTRVITIPNVEKPYTVKNRSNATVQIKTSTGTAFSIPTLAEAYIFCDGNNVITGRVITDGANAINALPDPFNNAALTGVPTAPTAPAGTSTTQIATTAFVTTALPIGSIIMWFGASTSVPTGWQVCNGTNGTPDLRDRFVVGAGSSYSLGDTGGADTVTLDVTQIPAHNHTATTNTVNLAHTHTFSGSGTTSSVNLAHNHTGVTDLHAGHNHNTTGGGSLAAGGGYRAATSDFTRDTSVAGAHTHSLNINNALGSHDHTVSVSGTTGAMSANQSHSHTVTVANTGGGNAHENRPPYFALFYIMRV